MPLAQAIVKSSDIRDTVEITDLLTTSNMAYIIQDSSYEKVDNVPNGPYSLAVSIEEEYDNNDTKIVWITNSEFISSDSDQMVGGANSQFLTSAVNYLCGQDISSSVTGKSISLGTLIAVSYTHLDVYKRQISSGKNNTYSFHKSSSSMIIDFPLSSIESL